MAASFCGNTITPVAFSRCLKLAVATGKIFLQTIVFMGTTFLRLFQKFIFHNFTSSTSISAYFQQQPEVGA
jgi:hypothetical protein